MASVSGGITIGEAQATVAALVKRQRGSTTALVGVLYGFILMCGAIGFGIGMWSRFDVTTTTLIAAAIGLVLWHFVGRRYIVWQFRRKLTARGVPLHVPIRVEISSEAFVYDSGDVVHHAQWSAISELYRQKRYWIFMVHANGYYLPGHFFPDDATERAFIAEALSYMSEAARARSKGATQFVEAA